jgi:hypothetical protein
MKDYRQFLNEDINRTIFENESDSNFYLDFISWLGKNGYTSSYDSKNPTKHWTEAEVSGATTKIVVTTLRDKPDRSEAKEAIKIFIQEYFNTPASEGIWKEKTSGTMGKIFISKNVSGLEKSKGPQNIDIYFKSKGGGTIDVQEVLTAALVLIGNTYNSPLSIEQADEILLEAQKQFSKVKGQVKDSSKILEAAKMNYADLAPSISSSNKILQIIKGGVSEAYWTGQTWHKDIIFLNPPIPGSGFKNYNSSDIILKGKNGKFYGFSLKKKKSIVGINPTLINKPASGNDSFLKEVLKPSELKSIEESRENFFIDILLEHTTKTEKELKGMLKGKKSKFWKEVGQLEKENITKKIKSKNNIFFKELAKKVPENGPEFLKNFFEKSFKTKLKTDVLLDALESNDFDFYLNTGIGTKTKNQIVFSPAKNQKLENTITVIQDMIDSKGGNLEVVLSESKTQAYDISEGEVGAGKIFFDINFNKEGESEKNTIVSLEVRYKGSYTPNPQFQAYTTNTFDELFSRFGDDLG